MHSVFSVTTIGWLLSICEESPNDTLANFLCSISLASFSPSYNTAIVKIATQDPNMAENVSGMYYIIGITKHSHFVFMGDLGGISLTSIHTMANS